MAAAKVLVLLLQLQVWSHLWSKGTQAYMVDGDPYMRAEFLDPDGKYLLQWKVDWETKRITFNVTVKTQGWVLFGLANDYKNSTGKDVVIGGVLGRDGEAYFSDRHEEGDGGDIAIPDVNKEDYKLEQALERRGETFLSFSRNLDSCDPEDYPISQNKATLVWAYGDVDDYDVPRREPPRRRGSYDVYLLEPDYTPRIARNTAGIPRLTGALATRDNSVRLWTVSVKARMPAAHTSYLCTIHKAPRLRRKHHVVGFNAHFPDRKVMEHVHHITVFKCNPPKGTTGRSIFDRFVDVPGEPCFIPLRTPSNPEGMPTHYCGQLHGARAIGGRPFFFPPQAGIPFGEEPDEYYMVQTHYDNPKEKSDVNVTVQMEYWYSRQLRPNDAGLMALGGDVPALPPSIIIPPQTTNYRVFSHCSSECTQRMYPPSGVTIFAGILHGHNSGVGIRLRHFDIQKKVELPWTIYDENYSNRFQQIRHLREEVKFLPGDQLTTECFYDNTWANSSVVGGFSTAQEMCFATLFYYSPIRDYSFCSSQIVSESGIRRFFGGLGNITWAEDKIDWVATSPRRLAGLTLTEIVDRMPWNSRDRAELQRFMEVTPMVSTCSRDLFTRRKKSLSEALEMRRDLPSPNPPIKVDTRDDFSGLVEYPFEAVPYVPPKMECKSSQRS